MGYRKKRKQTVPDRTSSLAQAMWALRWQERGDSRWGSQHIHTHCVCAARPRSAAETTRQGEVRVVPAATTLSLSRQRERGAVAGRNKTTVVRDWSVPLTSIFLERGKREDASAQSQKEPVEHLGSTQTHTYLSDEQTLFCLYWKRVAVNKTNTHTQKHIWRKTSTRIHCDSTEKRLFFFLRIRFRCESELATTESAHIHVCTRGGRQQRVAVQCYFASSSSTLGFKPSGGDAAVIVVVARTHTHTHTHNW